MRNIIVIGFTVLSVLGCKQNADSAMDKAVLPKIEESKKHVQVQGHRGERGHSPENTIAGFKNAIIKGVDVIELDVVVSADHQVVVSHEPYMSSDYVLTPEGDSLTRQTQKSYNLYTMTYDSIKAYEVGLKGNAKFPDQKRLSAYKPLLSEVIDSVEQFVKERQLKSVAYNIEIKSNPEQYGVFQPEPKHFVKLVMDVLQSKSVAGAYNIQSFDPEVLSELHKEYNNVTLAFLVSKGEVVDNLKRLTFVPEIYSPNYKLLDVAEVKTVRSFEMILIPWTVNEPEAIQEMLDLNVDGIITDYPERVIERIQTK